MPLRPQTSNVHRHHDNIHYPKTPPITKLPTYKTIASFLRLLNTNAASVHSERGSGLLGHLALTVSPAIYTTLSAIIFVEPINPSVIPIIPGTATMAQV
jgi:hypothetical protein